MEDIKTIHEVNPALAYLQGMLWAAFGVKVISTDCPFVNYEFDDVLH